MVSTWQPLLPQQGREPVDTVDGIRCRGTRPAKGDSLIDIPLVKTKSYNIDQELANIILELALRPELCSV